MGAFQDLKYKFNNLDVFGKIIAINVIIFVINLILHNLLRITFLTSYFTIPSEFNDFIFQPWSIITYGFLHNSIWHVLFNMLFLFYLSRVLLNLLNAKMVLNIYFLGIIFGGLAYLAFRNLMPASYFEVRGILLGASAGVAALLVFVGTYLPDAQIRLFGSFNVKWKHIAIFFVCLDLIRLVLGLNQGGYMAHMGGYLLGYVYAFRLQKGRDIGEGFGRLMDGFANLFKPKSTLKTVHKKRGKGSVAGHKKEEFKQYNKQKQIDLILDKISKSGYDSLTEEEKEFLFKAGKD
ncbi:MAG: rhomboid family intramembrane serine protease [Bacteroidota bacterium]